MAPAVPAAPTFWGAVVGFFKTVVGKLILKAVFVMAINAISKHFLPKPPKTLLGRQSIDIEYEGTIEEKRILLGEMMVSGLNYLPPYTTGATNEFLHQGLILCGHQINAITEVWFNQTLIPSANIAAVTGAAGDGNVTAGAYTNRANIRRNLGTSGQTVDFILDTAFTDWDSNCRLRGLANVALRYQVDEVAYKTGKPAIRFRAQGVLAYDPRLDSTNGGSGSHRYADPTTWAFTTDNALLLRHVLTLSRDLGGLGQAHTSIRDSLVRAAADVCDQNVLIPPASPTTNQKRYTCNGILMAGMAPDEKIAVLRRSMLGICYLSSADAKWVMWAGAWRSPSFTITDDDIIGPLNLRATAGRRDRFNAVRGAFVDPDREWQPSEFPAITNATFESQDNSVRLWLDAEFPFCTNNFEAQRNAILLNRLGRNDQIVPLTLHAGFWDVEAGDYGTLTCAELGYSAKTVQCTRIERFQQGYCVVALKEAQSTDWADPAVGDYQTPNTASSPTPGVNVPPVPTNFAATGGTNRITLSWSEPSSRPILSNEEYELWEYTASTPWSSSTRIWHGRATSVVVEKNDSTTRYYWLTIANSILQRSATVPVETSGLPAAAAAVDTSFRATASPGFAQGVADLGTITSTSVTVTPINGVPAYTHAWTRTSGSTDITANSASSATTSFTGVNMTVGNSPKTAIFRDTVTDSTGGTPLTTFVEVSVEISREVAG